MIFGTINEGIINILDEHMGVFRIETVDMVGVRTLTFQEFHVCGAPEFLGRKNPIDSRK